MKLVKIFVLYCHILLTIYAAFTFNPKKRKNNNQNVVLISARDTPAQTYRIERVLGKGRHGTVSLAVNVEDYDDKVALKEIFTSADDREVMRPDDIKREYMISEILGLTKGNLIISKKKMIIPLKFLDGVPASEFFLNPLINNADKFQVARQIIKKMKSLHKIGINHNDLHLENIIILKDSYEPFIVDMGRAKFVENGKSSTWVTLAKGRVKYMEFKANQYDYYRLGTSLKAMSNKEASYNPRLGDIAKRLLIDAEDFVQDLKKEIRQMHIPSEKTVEKAKPIEQAPSEDSDISKLKERKRFQFKNFMETNPTVAKLRNHFQTFIHPK